MTKLRKKRAISILMIVFMLVSLLQVPVFATGTDETEKNIDTSILENCSVQLTKEKSTRTDNFKAEETSVDVAVSLDKSVESCYMSVYLYPGNTTFDADSSVNKRLWSGQVTDGQEVTCNFNESYTPLTIGWKVVACLNVPISEDNYRSISSQSLEVVDEEGNGFEDYTYPDVKIDEEELQAGATSLHITLTGDERIFAAAREGKIDLRCAIAQYPDGESFDFEGANQISLANNLDAKNGFTNTEIKLSEPLKAGYRVRAVVYWSQNVDLMLAKGNDYESAFNRPDDSVLVSGISDSKETAIINGPVTEGDTSIQVTISGDIIEGSTILMKSYPAETTSFAMNEGTWIASAFNVTAGTYTLTPNEGTLVAGNKLVAFVQNAGNIQVQTAPVIIEKKIPFDITLKDKVTTESMSATFKVVAKDSSITNMNIVALCKVNSDGTADTQNYIARKFGQSPGEISFDIKEGSISNGDKICLVVTYANGESTYQSDSITVRNPLAADSLAITNSEITTETDKITVEVAGCEDYNGGRLILTAGTAANTDADSRTRLGDVTFTGEGTYTINVDSGKLKAGETVLPHLYLYDVELDKTYYKYGEQVTITSDEEDLKEAKVEIVTESIRADRTDLWASIDFKSSLTGTLKLYTYEGDEFSKDTATEIYAGSVSPNSTSQKITFGENKLTAGKRLVALLELSDGSSATSNVKVIQVVPEKQKPTASILDTSVTAGIAHLNVSMSFDSSVSNASYVLYQYTGDELNIATAQVIASGTMTKSETNKSIYVGGGKLLANSKLQLVLIADGEEAKSGVITVGESPNWGTPYVAFNVSAVKTDAENVTLTVDYSDEYLSLGDDFYCTVTVYQFPGTYSDEDFTDKELAESSVTSRVGQVSSRSGDTTKGEITIPIRDGAKLKAGDKLIVNLRLPDTEIKDEEEDFVSASIPIIDANETVPDYKVVLYNLDEDSSRGNRIRQILTNLNIPFETMTDSHLNETVGYLAGLEGYEAAGSEYTGEPSPDEFMLMCNLPEALLDSFLDAMTNGGIRIDHKAIVTAYNADSYFYELLGDIGKEHDSFQALIALNNMITDAEKLKEEDYSASDLWEAFKESLDTAKTVLSSYEPSYEKLTGAYEDLKTQYLALTRIKEMTGKAVINISKNAEGTYDLNVAVIGGEEGASYSYKWNDGSTGAELTNVKEEDLVSKIVTVTGESQYGNLTAQLQVPNKPELKVEAKSNSIIVKWNKPEEIENQMLPEKYVAEVYDGKTLVVTESADGNSDNLTVTGLDSSKVYNVKVYAVSIVGRSDKASFEVKTSAIDISSMTATLSYTTKQYSGKALKPSVSISGLSLGKDYEVTYEDNVEPGKGRVTITGIGNYTGTITKTFNITLAKPVISKVENVSKGQTIKWKKVSGASGYYLYCGSKRIKNITSGSTISYNYKSANKNGGKYTYKVVAYYKGETKAVVKSPASSSKKYYKINTVKLKTYKNNKSKSIDLKWTKNSKASGYQIQYSTSSSFNNAKVVKVNGSKKVSKTLTKLSKNKKYYVRVRSYKKVGKNIYYSSWSSKKVVTVRR